jgi:hypothetical protein
MCNSLRFDVVHEGNPLRLDARGSKSPLPVDDNVAAKPPFSASYVARAISAESLNLLIILTRFRRAFAHLAGLAIDVETL